jgi:AcrR family transcriptional regulator
MTADKRSPKRTSARGPAPTRGRDERASKRTELRRNATDVYRRAILDAAERVFSGGGLAEARMAVIAREAGMASGTLYNYFESKEEIFQSLITARGEELVAELEEVAGRGLQPVARLSATVAACLGHLERHREMFALFVQTPMLELALHGSLSEAAERVNRRCMRIFEDAVAWAAETGVLRRDIAPAELTVFLTGVMHAVVRAWLMNDRGRGSIGVKAATIMELFVSGAGAQR